MSESPPQQQPWTRTTERRVADRRRARRPITQEESWFGAFAPIEDTQLREDDLRNPIPGDSAFVSGFAGDARPSGGEFHGLGLDGGDGSASSEDSRFLARQAARLIETGQAAFERIYRVFVAARAALGIALLAAVAGGGLFGVRPSYPAIAVSLIYAVLAFTLWLLPHVRPHAIARPVNRLNGVQWGVTIGADLVCFSALHMLSLASNFNYVALLVLPVLMAGVLTPRRLALATAAAVTLVLLTVAWFTGGHGGDSAQQLAQAALAGAGFFVITVLAGELAVRLAREESSARGSMEMARQQAQLNRLVIEEMQDGVLVVDRRGRVRAANPAARRLLAPNGLSRPAPFQLRGVEAWSALVKAVEQAFVEATWPEAGRDIVLQFVDPVGAPAAGSRSGEKQRTLRVRVRFTRKREPQA
ncbi:MAG TPA: PAS domain-containing protein, partial [Burkholderiaceae bacterium]